jgi:hypothetical protein
MDPDALAAWIEAWLLPASEIRKGVQGELAWKGVDKYKVGSYISEIPSYAVGTKYLPKDMIILAHEGEAIIPKAENPYIQPAVSLGSIATKQAMANYGASSSSVVNNSSVDASTVINMAGATFVVREEADIDKIATVVAAKVIDARKAVGA